MHFSAKAALLLFIPGLLGMAAGPDRGRTLPPKGSPKSADAALIAELSLWEERALAEHYEFFQSLEVLQSAPRVEPTFTEQVAN